MQFLSRRSSYLLQPHALGLPQWHEEETFTERGYFNITMPFWIATVLAGEACRKWLPYM